MKNEKGKVVVVRFGDPNMAINRDDPERRKSFRARHNCDEPVPQDIGVVSNGVLVQKSITKGKTKMRYGRRVVLRSMRGSQKQIKMAIGIASDPRYKQGNYTGAYKQIEKIKKGLASHPQVVLRKVI